MTSGTLNTLSTSRASAEEIALSLSFQSLDVLLWVSRYIRCSWFLKPSSSSSSSSSEAAADKIVVLFPLSRDRLISRSPLSSLKRGSEFKNITQFSRWSVLSSEALSDICPSILLVVLVVVVIVVVVIVVIVVVFYVFHFRLEHHHRHRHRDLLLLSSSFLIVKYVIGRVYLILNSWWWCLFSIILW